MSKATIIGLIILGILIGGAVFVGLQSTLTEQVFIPEYSRVKCEECAEKVNVNYLMDRKVSSLSSVFSASTASFYCNGNFDKGKNVDIVQNGEKNLNYNYYPKGCSLTVTGTAEVFKCEIGTDNCEELPRQRITGVQNAEQPIVVQLQAPKDRLFISTRNDVTVIGTSQPYCLKLIEANNREDVVLGCTSGDLVSRFGASDFNILLKDAREQNINLNNPIGVLDEVEHIISGAKAVPSNEQLNIITHPKSGKRIYIFSLDGTYYPIEEAKGGILYADVNNPKKDDTIICRPSSPNCEGGIKLAPLDKTGQGCGLFKNIPSGFVRTSATEKCTFKCTEGKLEQDKCEEIKPEQINCPSGTIVIGNQCVINNEGNAAVACLNVGGKWVNEKTPTCDILCQLGLKEEVTVDKSYCDQRGFFAGNLPIFSILFGLGTALLLFLFLFNKFGQNPTNITISAILSIVAGFTVGYVWYSFGTAIAIITILVLIVLLVLYVLFGRLAGLLLLKR